MKKLGTQAAQTLMLGDTPYDVEAAQKVGIHTLIVRCGGFWKDKDFSGASAIYDSPADLLARWRENKAHSAFAEGASKDQKRI